MHAVYAFKAVYIVNAVATVKSLSYKPSGVEKMVQPPNRINN